MNKLVIESKTRRCDNDNTPLLHYYVPATYQCPKCREKYSESYFQTITSREKKYAQSRTI